MPLPTLGIIAGNGSLPLEIAKFYKQQNGDCCIAGIVGEFDAAALDLRTNLAYKSFSLGNVGAVVEYLKQHNVTDIVFAGGVKRPDLQSIKVDLVGAKLLSKILANKFIGDDKLLQVVANFFEQYGFKVISSHDVYHTHVRYNSLIAKTSPSAQDSSDIELAISVSHALGELDIGQSVIVEDGYVLGIEAAEGTDQLIERCASLRKKPTGAVLVKMPKLTQDMRLDLPTIGLGTIELLARYKYNGIALCTKSCVILDSTKIVEIANRHDMFIFDIQDR